MFETVTFTLTMPDARALLRVLYAVELARLEREQQISPDDAMRVKIMMWDISARERLARPDENKTMQPSPQAPA